ncbi:hypothetical protein JNM05_02680 [bacterium]|nr:hypothetical protein [bacterium]
MSENDKKDDEKTDDKKKVIEDLDSLSTNPTGIFKKADFDKMLGEYAKKKPEDMIDDIYAELEKKKSEKK